MNKCKNCGNKDLSKNSKYCNECGFFLKLNNKKIQYNPKKCKTMQLLKETLIEGSEAINEKNGNKSTNVNIQTYHALIWSYLIETTNINNLKNVTEENFTNSIITLLYDLKQCPEGNILNEFLYKINKTYEENENTAKVERKFIFYTNIKLKENDKNKFNKLLPLFNLKIFNYENYDFKEDNELCEKFKSSCLLLEYSTKGNNINIMKNNAINKLYLLFGYLTFLTNVYKSTERYHVNEISLKHNITDLEISSIIELDKNNSFIDYRESVDKIITSKQLEKSKHPQFNNNFLKYEFYEYLIKSENKKIVNTIKEYLILYYLAGNTKELDISFIKFWTLSEKIIKDIGGDMTDGKLVKYMQKILKYYGYPNYIQNSISHIKNKRNKLVHENINNIDQIDRNIIKLVADTIIWFIMEYNEIVKNMSEYKIILDYFNQDNKRTIELLNKIEEIKSQNNK